eukprot:908936-Rhodomonas_salina.1
MRWCSRVCVPASLPLSLWRCLYLGLCGCLGARAGRAARQADPGHLPSFLSPPSPLPSVFLYPPPSPHPSSSSLPLLLVPTPCYAPHGAEWGVRCGGV